MTDALVDKVARAISPCDKVEGWGRCETICPACDEQARAAILAVLDHFSEPGNYTEKMADAHAKADDQQTFDGFKRGFAASMRAARDEVSRG